MNIETILTTLAVIVGTGYIMPQMLENKKIINHFILRCGVVAMLYIFPIANIIYLYITWNNADKFFVILVAFNMGTLVYNIVMQQMHSREDKVNSMLMNINCSIANAYSSDKASATSITALTNMQEEQMKTNRSLIDEIEELKKGK